MDAHVRLPNEQPIPAVLLANKYDLIEDYESKGSRLENFMTQSYLDEFSDDNGFVGAFRTSAKTGHNVTESLCELIREVLQHDLNRFDQLDEESENAIVKEESKRGRELSVLGEEHKYRQKKKKQCCR